MRRIVGGVLVGLAVAGSVSGCFSFQPERAPRPATVPAGWQVEDYGKCSAAVPGDWKRETSPSAGQSDTYSSPDGGVFFLDEFTEIDKPPADEPLPKFVSARNPGGAVTETSRRTVRVPGTAVAYRITARDDAGAELAVLHTWGRSQKGAWLVLSSPQGTDVTAEQIIRTYTCAL